MNSDKILNINYNLNNFALDYSKMLMNIIQILNSTIENEKKSNEEILNEFQDFLMENEIKIDEAISNVTLLFIKSQLIKYSKIKQIDNRKYEEGLNRKFYDLTKRAEIYAKEIKNINNDLDKLNFD
jgi:division protein CdvB (Snf7/Vps24/ESCRT-III family)